MSNKKDENKSFIAIMTAGAVEKIILHNNEMTFQEASNSFLRSQTYQLLIKNPKLYCHEGADYFYDLWQNEQKYGHPIPSFLLELEGKI